jgi:hypothetical protein
MTVRSLARPVGRLARPRHSEAFRELGIFALAYVVYFGVRALTEGTAAAAMQHALDLIRFERQVGLDWERTIQDGIVGSRLLVDVANSVYMYGHWPVIIVTGVLLFRHRRPHYYRLRNASLLSGMVGLVIFALYPVAPPRLTDLPLVDTVTQNADGYRQLVPASLVNQYAALPSFHAGWNVLLGIVVFRATTHWLLRGMAIAGPAAMVVAVVATANHYVIDVMAGIAIVLAGLVLLGRADRATTRPTLVCADELERAAPPHVIRRRAQGRQRPGAPANRRGAARPARGG